MSGLGAAGAAAAAVTGAQVLAALVSPLPLLVLGGLVAPIMLAVAVLLLTPLWSSDPDRNARAAAMLDRVVAAIPSSRAPQTPHRIDNPTAPAAAPERPGRGRWRRQHR